MAIASAFQKLAFIGRYSIVMQRNMVVTMFSVALLGGCGSTPASTGESTQTQIEAITKEVLREILANR